MKKQQRLKSNQSLRIEWLKNQRNRQHSGSSQRSRLLTLYMWTLWKQTANMIIKAFTENIKMPTAADELKFRQFKRYVESQCLHIKPENWSWKITRCEKKVTNVKNKRCPKLLESNDNDKYQMLPRTLEFLHSKLWL